MILYVRHHYVANVIPQRKRNPVERVHEAVVPVEIRELEPSAAPLALVAEYGGRKVPHRLVDGDLWAPAEFEGAALTAESLERAASSALGGADAPDPFGTAGRPRGEAGKGEPGSDGSKVRATDEVRRRAAIQARADRLLLVDGVAYTRVPEPVYVVQPRRGGRMLVAKPLAAPGSDADANPHFTFRADEAGFAESDGRARGVAEDGAIEVILPEALRYDGAGMEVRDTARLVRDNLAKLILDGGDDTFRAYRGLRDALAAPRDGASAEEADAEVVERLREALDPAIGVDAYWASRGAAALARLDARALADEFEQVARF